MVQDTLSSYRKKRNFKKTPEPLGRAKKRTAKAPIFVIQKHDATRLHYDLRLEIDGVLKSWAVPKGPSTNPKDKRLAIQTEDHPLAYANFEGVIPEDNYGAGPVMIWDKGTYRSIKREMSMSDWFKQGHIEVKLKGKKIQGDYALIRTNFPGKKRWLLIKMKDQYADARRKPTRTENRSVVTNRTLHEIEKDAQ
jgi:DNA ligase D-like protein (predicted 3'-phosphoesterase)